MGTLITQHDLYASRQLEGQDYGCGHGDFVNYVQHVDEKLPGLGINLGGHNDFITGADQARLIGYGYRRIWVVNNDFVGINKIHIRLFIYIQVTIGLVSYNCWLKLFA